MLGGIFLRHYQLFLDLWGLATKLLKKLYQKRKKNGTSRFGKAFLKAF
jgi:hypothetical protein